VYIWNYFCNCRCCAVELVSLLQYHSAQIGSFISAFSEVRAGDWSTFNFTPYSWRQYSGDGSDADP